MNIFCIIVELMNRPNKAPPRGLLVFYRILIVIASILALSLLGGTIYVLIAHSRVPNRALSPNLSPNSSQQQSASDRIQSPSFTSDRIFTGIGRLRLSTAPPQPIMVILSIAFPYNPDDKAFSEELASRIKDIRSITSDYFASITENELRLRDEGEIKSELLSRYNAILRLGQLTTLFFNDYMIIE
jgi:flagellar basal body-associated protein FliL